MWSVQVNDEEVAVATPRQSRGGLVVIGCSYMKSVQQVKRDPQVGKMGMDTKRVPARLDSGGTP